MIRFHRIFDHVTEVEQRRMRKVQAIFRKAFPAVPAYAERIAEIIARRGELGLDVVLLTAEDERERVVGFALAHHYAGIQYSYLDYLASDPEARHRGLGAALYEALREHLTRKGSHGLFMDVPPDDPAPLGRSDARKAVRAILTLKYGWDPADPYTVEVVESFKDDPVRLRPRATSSPSRRRAPITGG